MALLCLPGRALPVTEKVRRRRSFLVVRLLFSLLHRVAFTDGMLQEMSYDLRLGTGLLRLP